MADKIQKPESEWTNMFDTGGISYSQRKRTEAAFTGEYYH